MNITMQHTFPMQHTLVADIARLRTQDFGSNRLSREIHRICRPWYISVLIVANKALSPNGLHQVWYSPLKDTTIEFVAVAYHEILNYIKNTSPELWVTHIETRSNEFFINEIFKEVTDSYHLEHVVTEEALLVKYMIKMEI